MTVTLGVDLAADRSRTALVQIDWTDRRVTEAMVDVDDDAIVVRAHQADKIGIDCPLGWPDAFIDFVTSHRAGHVARTADTIGARRQLVYRATDLYCMDRGIRPLSVAADRIAHAALRCAALLARLGEPDRSGAGRVVEAYPAGSLQLWGLPHRSYKNDPVQIAASLDELTDQIGLDFEAGTRAVCLGSDHAFDAFVVALSARAAALGRTESPPPQLMDAARREGWIALPDPALEALRA